MSEGKPQDETQMEYFLAKKQAGRLPQYIEEQHKRNIAVSMKNDKKQISTDGFVSEAQFKNNDSNFERYQEVTFTQKASDRAKKNPLIIIGMLGTVAALTFGLRATSRGDKWQSQLMMRARIGAQGFTIFAILASIMYAGQSFDAPTAKNTMSKAIPTEKKTTTS